LMRAGSPRARRERHSFPTRRSSDLTYADELVAVSCTGKGEAFMEAVTAGKLAAALEAGVPLEEALRRALAGVARRGGDGGIIAVDRKSTRLNSSHVKISYAVFCLKK